MKIKCTCSNPYQDNKYGKNIRVANKTGKTAGVKPIGHCTVCGRESTE